MNKWLQLHIVLNAEQADSASDYLCEELGALAVTLNPAEDHPLFQLEPGDMPLWERLVVTALFTPDENATKIIDHLITNNLIDPKSSWHHEILEEKDWVHETQSQFPAKSFAEKLWVIPSWDEGEYSNPKIYIDPGLAFGTGTHPTTSLCLEWLAQNPPIDKTVIDFGCGSGILSLGAIAMGAKTVYAVDHDEQAILATEQNCQLNPNMQVKLHVGTDAILPANLQAELIIANILAEPLLTLHPILLKHTADRGTLILSGLLESDYDKIVDCYQNGFTLLDKQLDEEWLRLVFVKN